MTLPAVVRDYRDHVRLFTRNARLYLAGTFFFGFGLGTFWVLLNLYLRGLGLSDTLIGRVLSVQSLGTVLVAVPAGMLATRVRLKWLLVAATLLAAGAYAALVTARAYPLLLVAAGAAGAAFIVHNILAAPFFMRNSSPRERVYLFGVNFTVEILASVIGVAGGGWLASFAGHRLGSETAGLRIALLAATGFVTLSVIPYLWIHSPAPAAGDRAGLRSWRVRHPGLVARLAVPAFLVGSGAGLIIPFLNLYFRDRFGLDPDHIGWIFSVAQAVTALGFISGPVMARKLGMVRAAVTTEVLSIPFFITLAVTRRLDLAILAFWMRGALMNMNQPISRNFAMEMIPEGEQPVVNSVLELSWNVSWMLSTQAGGWLIDRHGFTLPMFVTPALYLGASALYFSFFHDAERKRGITLRAAPVPAPPGG